MRYCMCGSNVRSLRPDTGGVLESGCRFCRCTRSAPHVVVPLKSRSFVAFLTDSHRIKKHCPVFAPSIRGPLPTDTAIALSRRGTHLTNVLSIGRRWLLVLPTLRRSWRGRPKPILPIAVVSRRRKSVGYWPLVINISTHSGARLKAGSRLSRDVTAVG